MTIHFFTIKDKNSATARYRGYLIAEELAKRNYSVLVHPALSQLSSANNIQRLKKIFGYFKILFSTKSGDIIYLVRTAYHLDFYVLTVIFKTIFKRKIIFDFDDSIFSRPGIAKRVIKLTTMADAVIVGGHYLADWAKKYNSNIHIIPTSIPFDVYSRFSRTSRPDNKKFTIGWIGTGPNNYQNLKILVPVFQKLIQDKVEFKFILIGALGDKRIYKLFRDIKNLEVELIDALDWQHTANIPKAIQQFDVGLMPLVDNDDNRGRCAFKAIEYMACSVPAILSPVGENNYLIDDNLNGFLAGSTQDWVAKIKKLQSNKDYNYDLGQISAQTVLSHYSYAANIPKIEKIIKQVLCN